MSVRRLFVTQFFEELGAKAPSKSTGPVMGVFLAPRGVLTNLGKGLDYSVL